MGAIHPLARAPSDRDKDKTATTPKEFAVTTPPQTPMLDHSFTLQAVMEMQKTLGELGVKIDRAIDDIKSQVAKVDEIRHQASFIKGGLAASVVFITFIIGIASWVLNAKWDAILNAVAALKAIPK
jgi:hypothetical protein